MSIIPASQVLLGREPSLKNHPGPGNVRPGFFGPLNLILGDMESLSSLINLIPGPVPPEITPSGFGIMNFHFKNMHAGTRRTKGGEDTSVLV